MVQEDTELASLEKRTLLGVVDTMDRQQRCNSMVQAPGRVQDTASETDRMAGSLKTVRA